MRQRLVLGLALALIFAASGCRASTPSEPVPAPEQPQPSATPTPVTALLELSAVGERVLLDAPVSLAAAMGTTYAWRQVSGPATPFSDAKARRPSVIPPEAGVYVFELTVRDGAVVTALVLVEVPVAPASATPSVALVTPAPGLFGGKLTLEFRALEPDADPASAEMSFSTDGGGSYAPAAAIPESISRPGGGVIHLMVWDVAADFGSDVVVDVLVRVSLGPTSVVLPMTYAPLFDGVSAACRLGAQAWPIDASARAEIDDALDGCQRDLVVQLVELVEREVAPRVADFDGVLLLNLPLFVDAHASAASEEGVEVAGLAFLLERALEAVPQLESLSLNVAVADPGEGQDIGAEIGRFQTLSNTSRLRHDMAMAAIRNLR